MSDPTTAGRVDRSEFLALVTQALGAGRAAIQAKDATIASLRQQVTDAGLPDDQVAQEPFDTTELLGFMAEVETEADPATGEPTDLPTPPADLPPAPPTDSTVGVDPGAGGALDPATGLPTNPADPNAPIPEPFVP